MELKVNYIVKKILNKLDIFKIKSKVIFDNFYVMNLPKNISEIRKILLYFPDYQMMHLGDHLFFEPLLRELKKYGYKVEIQPIKLMEFYFLNLGYSLGELKNKKYDLIISRTEFYPSLKKYGDPIIYIEIANHKISQPLCFDIIQKIFKILCIDNIQINDIPQMIERNLYQQSIEIEKSSEKYILFNNYIDSGSFRVTRKQYEKLNKFVVDLKARTGYKIIHTGSYNDKQKDNNEYGFVDIDLRGKTSIEDLFDLVQLDNVIYNVSFDAFQMHLFFLQNKKSYIIFRGRFMQKYANLFINHFNPPFKIDDSSKIIEYI